MGQSKQKSHLKRRCQMPQNSRFDSRFQFLLCLIFALNNFCIAKVSYKIFQGAMQKYVHSEGGEGTQKKPLKQEGAPQGKNVLSCNSQTLITWEAS